MPEPPPRFQRGKLTVVPLCQVTWLSSEYSVNARPPVMPESLPSPAGGSVGESVMVQGPACQVGTPPGLASSVVTGGVVSTMT